jgi:DNA-binding protein HU-beta
VVKRAKRAGRNPRTGEAVTIKAHKAVRFRPAKALKDMVT